MGKMARILLISGGIICVVLGFLGIFLPILPTTPFLLLAAFLFTRSSGRFLNWLLSNRWFGAYIKNYREGRGIPAREKAFTILMLWATIGFTVFYIVPAWWVQGILLVIAVGVTTHLLRVKTYRPDVDVPENQRSYRPE